MGGEKPDYVGQFIVPWAPTEKVGPHTFWLYVTGNEPSKANSNARLIKGFSQDTFGRADIEGIISRDAVQLVKKYDDLKGSKGQIIYQGETGQSLNGYPVQNAYLGQYFMDPASIQALAIGPFVMFPFDSQQHPYPNQGELEIFTQEKVDEILKLTGLEKYKVIETPGRTESSIMITAGCEEFQAEQMTIVSTSRNPIKTGQEMINAFEKKHSFR